jgi:hypothetical protein
MIVLKRTTDISGYYKPFDKHNDVGGEVGNLNKATVQNYPVLLSSSKNC